MINRELIVLDSELKDREDIIEFLANKALNIGYISSLDEYIDAVKKRESEFSTAIGYGVSIPHGKSSAVDRAFIGFLRCREEIKWSEDQKEKVRLIFLLGVPENKKETLHLKILAQISRKLMDEEFRKKLLCNDTEKVFQLLNEIEQNISSEN
ncbi:PTS sugar transporter subunit IIA [Clostridium nigeriense]|uniref:PTS sugar transporter subunit IIA n=1 Tax=Clostridium nigeriense TaxID=1805470 RepID=UPI0008337B4F|nr:PTS sugar transporter subunit IIA [Clostridium nigeriense]